jgi:hypothetical protein
MEFLDKDPNIHKFLKKQKKKLINSKKPKIKYSITPEILISKWNNGENIDKYVNNVNWIHVSMHKHLPKMFMITYKKYLNWLYIYKYQLLSDDLIESSGYDLTKWTPIIKFQQVSESFVKKHYMHVNWNLVWRYVNYSEKFVKEFLYIVNWDIVSYIIKISDPELLPFVKKDNNWLYLGNTLKHHLISSHYKIIKENNTYYVECYKATRNDLSSIYSPNVKFDEPDKTYVTNCDYNYNNKNSFGFGCWTREEAKYFALSKKIQNYKIIKIKTPLKYCCWVGSFRPNDLYLNDTYDAYYMNNTRYLDNNIGKLRTSKFTIVEILN